MKRILTVLVSGLALSSCAQQDSLYPFPEPQREAHYFQLGDRSVQLSVYQYGGDRGPLFLKLHDNEKTAEEAVRAVLQQSGGRLIVLENKGERNLRFSLRGKGYEFDPNRIFSTAGIRSSLQLFGAYTPAAAAEVERLASFLLSHLPDSLPLIALHNNTDSAFDLTDFTSGSLQKEVLAVHPVPESDPDDFLFTTDSTLYHLFREDGLSVVLQHNAAAKDDGSLSVYYGKRGGRYVNVEAQFGHGEEQQRMIEAVLRRLRAED